MASDAVGLEYISRIIGYKITKGNFSNSTPNLPQRIAIIGEANTANQGTLDISATEITTAQQAGQLYGFGSPIHAVMRILRPNSGSGIGGIPTVVYAQPAAGSSAAKVIDVTPTGTATGNATHYLKVAGRTGVDGKFYAINIVEGDTVADIAGKITDAVNGVLSSPVTAATADTPDRSTLTAKWTGLTSNSIVVSVDTNNQDVGVTYAVTNITAGSGTPSISSALNSFGNEWNTIVINTYGTESTILDTLEDFNGIPDPAIPTGRYSGIIMKPFIALTGSVSDDPSSVTDARDTEVTIAICPAPNSAGMQYEAAANMAVLFGRVSQDTPNLDVAGKSYPDMPTPTSIGSMADYPTRNTILAKGCSVVDLVSGAYQVQNFVTTYHPDGEEPAQFSNCRNLVIDFNVRYGYYLKEIINVLDHSISNDSDIVTASKVVKPKQWKQIISDYATDLARRALIVDAPFMQDSIEVNISTVNPDRFETFFRYKRTGFVRVASTTAEAGFNFGTV